MQEPPLLRPLLRIVALEGSSVLRLCHIPRLDDPALRLVDVRLVLDALDADLEAVLCPNDVFAPHALRGRLADLLGAEPDVVADVADDAEDYKEYDEREDLAAKAWFTC